MHGKILTFIAMKRYLLICMLITLATPAFSQTVRDTVSHVRLRNTTVVAGQKEPGPLIIIDDIVYDSLRIASDPSLQTRKNPLELLNVDNIETINVLNRESAMLIYGTKARYGALIIKTKTKGDPGRKIEKKKTGNTQP